MLKATSLEQRFFPTKSQMLSKVTLPKIDLVSNHYTINFSKGVKFDEWNMRFFARKDEKQVLVNPDALEQSIAPDCRSLIEEVVQVNAREIARIFGKHFYSGASLFTASARDQKKERKVFVSHHEHIVLIDIKHKEMDPSMLNNSECDGARSMFVRLLNAFLKSNMAKLGYKAFGRTLKYYNMNDSSKINQHNVEIYKGFTTSIDTYERGILMLADYSAKIVRNKNLMEEMIDNNVDLDNDDAIRDYCIGMLVISTYSNDRIYRIDDVDFETRITDKFPNPAYKNYEDYYLKKYNKGQLKYKNQFMLVNKNRKKQISDDGRIVTKVETTKLLPELMRPTGLTDNMRKDFNVMRDIGKHTILNPKERFPTVAEFTQKASAEASQNKDFNFTIDTKSNKVVGYLLKPPVIKTGMKCAVTRADRVNVDKAVKSKNIDNWAIVYDSRTDKDVNTIVKHLQAAGGKFGVKVNNPVSTTILPRNLMDKDLDKIVSSCKNGKPDIIFFFISRMSAKTAYKKAKRFMQRKGITSQFFTSYNPSKDNDKPSKFMNLLSQMIVKMGGSVWEVELDMPDTMVAGADVYHGPRNQSVASLVTQWGKNFTEFFSMPKIQKKGLELMHNMASMVLDSIKQYKKQNGKVPKQFIFFRDGVGEGQIDAVQKCEVAKIRDALDSEYKELAPKLMFVIVTKRLSDRFAVQSRDGLINPDGGVVVLDNVVKNGRANFFLVAQKVTQGTATPTHYEVIYDDTGISLNNLIDMAYQFTFGYSNWMGPVKVPAPVQYAHKQAALIGVTQDDVVSAALLKTRHYM